MIDIDKAKNVFNEYVKDFKTSDKKVEIKIKHTFGVVKAAEYIAKNLNLSEEDIELAKLIGLLHDIGRFEQVVKFDSFHDYENIDHAEFGADLLFKEGFITKFIEDRQFDNIIEKAIRMHNKFSVDKEKFSDRELLHINIIRDADKTDNLVAKKEQDFMSLFKKTEDEVGRELITDKVWQEFLDRKTIVSSHRVTSMDSWLSYIAWVFDYNYTPGLKYLQENKCIDNLIDRLNYTERDTKEKMEYARKITNEYIDERLLNNSGK